MKEEISKCLLHGLIQPVNGTEKVAYPPVKRSKSDHYCILISFSMDFNLSPLLVIGRQEDFFQLERWGLSTAHKLFMIKCPGSAKDGLRYSC